MGDEHRSVSVPLHSTRSGIRRRDIEPFWQKDGLAVIEQTWVGEDTWSVTHVASGYAIVTNIPLCDIAIDLAESLLPLTDWGRSGPDLTSDINLVRRMVEVRAAHYARWESR